MINGLFLYLLRINATTSGQNTAITETPGATSRKNRKNNLNIKVSKNSDYILVAPPGAQYHLRIDKRYSNLNKFLSPVHYTNESTGVHIYFDKHGKIIDINHYNADSYISDQEITGDKKIAQDLYESVISELNYQILIKESKLKSFINTSYAGKAVKPNELDSIGEIIKDLRHYYPYRAKYFDFIDNILTTLHSPKTKELFKPMLEASNQESNNQEEHRDAGSPKEEIKEINYNYLIEIEIKKLIEEINKYIQSKSLENLVKNMPLLSEMQTISINEKLAETYNDANKFILEEFKKYKLSSMKVIFGNYETSIPKESHKDFLDNILSHNNTDEDISVLKYLFENSCVFREELYKYADYYLLELYKQNKLSAFKGLLEAGYDPNHVVNQELLMTAIIKNNLPGSPPLKEYLEILIDRGVNVNQDIRFSFLRDIIKAHKIRSRESEQNKMSLIKSDYMIFITTNPVFVALELKKYDEVEKLMPHLNLENLLLLLSNVISSKSVILRKIFTHFGGVLNFAMNDEESFSIMLDKDSITEGIKYKPPLGIILMPNSESENRREEIFYIFISKVVDEVNKRVAERRGTSIISKLFDKYEDALFIAKISENKHADYTNSKMLLFCSLFDLAINGNEVNLKKYINKYAEEKEKKSFPCTEGFLKKTPPKFLDMSTIVEVPYDEKVEFFALGAMILVLKPKDISHKISYINLNNDSNFSHVDNYINRKLRSGNSYTASIYLVKYSKSFEDWGESKGFLASILEKYKIETILDGVIRVDSKNQVGFFERGNLNESLTTLNENEFSHLRGHYLTLLSFYRQYNPSKEHKLSKINTGIPVYDTANTRKDFTDFFKAARAYDLKKIQELLINTHVVNLTCPCASSLKPVASMEGIIKNMVESMNTITDFLSVSSFLKTTLKLEIKKMFEVRLEDLRRKLSLNSNQEQKENEEDIVKAKLKNIISCLKILVLHDFAKPTDIKNKVINWYFGVLLSSFVTAEARGFALNACIASRGICQKKDQNFYVNDNGDVEKTKNFSDIFRLLKNKFISDSGILDFSDILLLQPKNVTDNVIKIKMPEGPFPCTKVLKKLKEINGEGKFNDVVDDMNLYYKCQE